MSPGLRRLCALGALLVGLASVVVALVVLWNNWAALLGALVLLVVAIMAAWYVVTRRGIVRVVATAVAVGALVTALATLLRRHSIAGIVAVVILVVVGAALARIALRPARAAPEVQAPPGVPVGAAHAPVLILNPWSGGGSPAPSSRPRRSPGASRR